MRKDEIEQRAIKFPTPFGGWGYRFRFNEQKQQYELALRKSNGEIEWIRSPTEDK